MEENNKKNSWLVFAFLAWFIISMMAMFYFSEVNNKICIMLVGQYFLVFGIIPLASKKDRSLIGVPILLVGLGCIFIPLFEMFPNIIKVAVDWDKVIPFVFCSILIIVGIGVIFLPQLKEKLGRKRCTVEVDAVVDDMIDGELSAPVYLYMFEGKEYSKTSSLYSNFGLPKPGDRVKLLINPEDPEEVLEPFRGKILAIIIGILLVIAGVVINYLVLTQ